MSASKSNKPPPPNRLLAYKPSVSPDAKRGPVRLNTKGQAPSGRNVGKLADVLKMPLDVFYEIVSHLRPLDILQLARASLKLRASLMSRNSAHAWIAARRAIEMPECPPDLSEPQYASLVFEHTCSACGVVRAMKHSAQLKVRFCGNCWKENVWTNHELKAGLMPNKWNSGFSLDLLPSANDVYCIVGRSLRCTFYKPEYDAVLKRYVELKKAGQPPALLAYVKERGEFVQQSFEFGRDVDAWWSRYSAEVSAEKEKVREIKDEDKMERKNIVHAKLARAGYSPIDYPRWIPEWEKTVTKRVNLTDKYWNSTMFPKLKEMIEMEQARKEQARRKARLRERTLEFARIYRSRGVPENEPEDGPFMMPSWGIFEDDPRVKALLEEDDCKIPFTEDRYERIEDLIAEGVARYNIRARRDLARMHGVSLFFWGSQQDVDEKIIQPFLARATTVFHMECEAAPGCLSYQTITEILHLSLVYWEPAIGEPPKWSSLLLGLTPDILAGKITRELLRIVGAQEDSTWEQMERICGKRLVCTCRRPGFRQPVHITTLIQHIRHERMWSASSEAERWRHDGSESESDSPIDHAVSQIHNFVKILPEGETFDAFMRSQPPPLGGSVGNLANIQNPLATLVQVLGIAPPLEERRFMCSHCGSSMTDDYLVWHMNAKHHKIARPSDVSTWTFPAGMLDMGSDDDGDGDDNDYGESDLEMENLIRSLLH